MHPHKLQSYTIDMYDLCFRRKVLKGKLDMYIYVRV